MYNVCYTKQCATKFITCLFGLLYPCFLLVIFVVPIVISSSNFGSRLLLLGDHLVVSLLFRVVAFGV